MHNRQLLEKSGESSEPNQCGDGGRECPADKRRHRERTRFYHLNITALKPSNVSFANARQGVGVRFA